MQCKKVSKPPMSKMLKKVDIDNKGTKEMNVSEKSKERTRERLSGIRGKDK